MEYYEERKAGGGGRKATRRRKAWNIETPCITVSGGKDAKKIFVEDYMVDHPELGSWDEGLGYSVNKNKRWKIKDELFRIFSDEIEDISEESFNVVATIVHDPNTVCNYKNDAKSPKYFFNNRADKAVFVGRQRSLVPVHEASSDNEVRIVIQDDESHIGSRQKNFVKYQNEHTYCKCAKMYKIRSKKRTNAVYDIFDVDIEEEEPDEDGDDGKHYDISNRSNFPLLQDFICKPSQSIRKKNLGPVKVNKPVKGKMIYEQGQLEEGAANLANNEFEQIDYYSPTEDTAIVFLTDIWASLPDWSDISERWASRRTMYNSKLGLFLTLDPVDLHDTITECRLKVTSGTVKLLYSPLGSHTDSILDLLSQLQSLDDLCRVAGQLLSDGCRINTTKQKYYSYFNRSDAFIEIVDTLSSKCSTRKEILMVGEQECGICFGVERLSYSVCGEGFCDTCWSVYLHSQVQGQHQGCLLCPGHACSAPAPVTVLTWFLPQATLVDYVTSLLDYEARTDLNIFLCPRPLCQRFIRIESARIVDVECACGQVLCRTCRQAGHAPSSCAELHDYWRFQDQLKKFESLESSVEVRTCPKCKTPWEKMWGCNYMQCTRCSTCFCWGCGKKHATVENEVCGNITVPLEKIEILAFPTESFSKRRIDAFYLCTQLREQKMKTTKILVNRLILKYLAADRDWYLASLQDTSTDILETDRGAAVSRQIGRAMQLCTQGRRFVINSLLKRENTGPSRMKQIVVVYSQLANLHDILTNGRPGRDWEASLKVVEDMTRRLERRINIPKH